MKKIIYLLLFVCSLFTFTACDRVTPLPDPIKLDTPVLTINDNGIVSWEAVENATSYKFRIDNSFSCITSSLMVQLNDGETITVMALGDGTTYLDSDFSEPVKYTKPANQPSEDETTKDATTPEDTPTDVVTGDTPTEDVPTTDIPTEDVPTSDTPTTDTPTTDDPTVHTCDFTGEWAFDGTHHWHICECGEMDSKVAHSGGEATLTEKAKCSVCGAKYGQVKEPEEPTPEVPTPEVPEEPTPEEPTQDIPGVDDTVDLSKVIFSDASFAHDGTAKSIEVENLPEGVTVVYEGNNVTEVGTYTVTAKLYDVNNTLLKELTAEIEIYEGIEVELPLV